MILPLAVRKKLGRRLCMNPQNPVGQIAARVHNYFRSQEFQVLNDETDKEKYAFLNNPYVSVRENFDALLFPPTHPGRSPSDTFYLIPPDKSKNCQDTLLGFQPILPVHQNPDTQLLRTHATAHLPHVISRGIYRGIWTVDVFRKDEVNATHSPVFHQTDGVSIWKTEHKDDQIIERTSESLKVLLSDLVSAILGESIPQRWSSDSFPFTEPSYQLELLSTFPLTTDTNSVQVKEEKWIEVLGCGVLKRALLPCSDDECMTGWAFGLGLERLTMLAYQIPDVRLLWSEDLRFTSQFEDGQIRHFKPFSRHPPTVRDLSVWFPAAESPMSDTQVAALTQLLSEVADEEAPELVAEIAVRDRYHNGDHESIGWRLVYQALNSTLTHHQVNAFQRAIIKRLRYDYHWDTRGG